MCDLLNCGSCFFNTIKNRNLWIISMRICNHCWNKLKISPEERRHSIRKAGFQPCPTQNTETNDSLCPAPAACFSLSMWAGGSACPFPIKAKFWERINFHFDFTELSLGLGPLRRKAWTDEHISQPLAHLQLSFPREIAVPQAIPLHLCWWNSKGEGRELPESLWVSTWTTSCKIPGSN